MTYDFIVIGSGPAGSIIASRLARSAKAPKVLLLEAGGRNDDMNTRILAERYSTFMTYPAMNWGYKSAPQEALGGRELDYARGKGLGGSSAINFACYTIGPKDDFDEWARLVGDDAFNWQNARRRFDKIEAYGVDTTKHYQKYAKPSAAQHGTKGPLHVEFADTLERSMTDVLDAVSESGWQLNPDVNSGNPLGVGIVPATAHKGRRSTAASAFLADLPPNLTVVTDAPVTKCVFDGKRAVGVVAAGKQYTASKEIILSAGALDTPKLLLLSGVGPKEELMRHDIDVISELSGVGKNLQDHYFVPVTVQLDDGANDRAALFSNPDALQAAKQRFEKDGTGPLTIFYTSIIMGWIRNENLFSTEEFKALPAPFQEHMRRPTVPSWELISHSPVFTPLADPARACLTMCVCGMVPASRGTVTLASADPNDPPVADPRMFSDPFDRRNVTEAIKTILALLKTPTIAKDVVSDFDVPLTTSDKDIWAFVQTHVISTWHMSCTVKMGKKDDEMACVDSNFRVRGVEGLRVADMSVTPFVPNCHVVSIAYQIGEAAAEKLIEEYRLQA